jgi:hypothetical protein
MELYRQMSSATRRSYGSSKISFWAELAVFHFHLLFFVPNFHRMFQTHVPKNFRKANAGIFFSRFAQNSFITAAANYHCRQFKTRAFLK